MSKSVMEMTVFVCIYIYISFTLKGMERIYNKPIETATVSNGPAQVQEALRAVLFHELERTHRCLPKVYIFYRLHAQGS